MLLVNKGSNVNKRMFYQTFKLNGYSVDWEGIRQFVATSFRFLLLSKSSKSGLNTKTLARHHT